MPYFLGGYYLLKLRPRTSARASECVFTASDCINDNLVNSWAYSWATGTNQQTKGAKENFGLSDEKVKDIRKWVESEYDAEKRFGWINVFFDIDTALECKRKFFHQVEDVKLFALYFEESEAEEIFREFKPQSDDEGEIGLYTILSKQVAEVDDEKELLIGYDLIGIEYGGSFHTFHCHDIGIELSERFGLTLNEFGLFDAHSDWKPVLDFLNDEENGCEPVPWFVVKVKQVRISAL